MKNVLNTTNLDVSQLRTTPEEVKEIIERLKMSS